MPTAVRPSRQTTLNRLALLLLGVVALFALLIAAELFDPRPLGPLRDSAASSSLSVPAGATAVHWQEDRPPAGPFSVKLEAALRSGGSDSGYGLLLQTASGLTAVLISPLGYAAILQGGDADALWGAGAPMPWQPWPHVRRDTAVNELWLNLDGQRLVVRLNGELLWSGPLAEPITRLGLAGQSFGETAVIDFPALDLYAGP